jgi:hypothetical protein
LAGSIETISKLRVTVATASCSAVAADGTAVEDGTAAVERLIERLADVPTPASETPRQLTQHGRFIPLNDLYV